MPTVQQVASPFTVPANSSRFFDTADEARRQPQATVRLVWDDEDPYLYNDAFDPSLIAHDSSYCTSVSNLSGDVQLPTLNYLDRVLRRVAPREIVDIGCGQGEFVTALRARGMNACGFDPVVRTPTPWLFDGYWTPGDRPEAGLFVMRCVLPHIPNPWAWIEAMGQEHPGALLLLEYQRLEWMAEHGVWYQLSHDHVNQFRLVDFEARFDVVDSGTFGDDEWSWVLLRPDSGRAAPARRCDSADLVSSLVEARESMIIRLVDAESVVLWGAAGKGVVLADALDRAGAHLRFAVDADKSRWGRFMEVSALGIVSPNEGVRNLGDSTLVVCNPRHTNAVLALISDLGGDVTVLEDPRL